jgi:hypothetical protein
VAEARKKTSRVKAAQREHITDQVRADVYARDKGICYLCGRATDLGNVARWPEWDHVVPISLGGSNEKHNLAIACRTCNRRKGAFPPLAYLRSLTYTQKVAALDRLAARRIQVPGVRKPGVKKRASKQDGAAATDRMLADAVARLYQDHPPRRAV